MLEVKTKKFWVTAQIWGFSQLKSHIYIYKIEDKYSNSNKANEENDSGLNVNSNKKETSETE